MRKISYIFMLVGIALLFQSCGMNSALVANQNQNHTQVQLSSNNYKVIDRVSGSAEVEYFLMIGGLTKRQLYENAYAAMLSKANLLNGPRALVHVVTEEHIGGVPPFYLKRTITISAHVVEFTK
jgi:hypothetical protein